MRLIVGHRGHQRLHLPRRHNHIVVHVVGGWAAFEAERVVTVELLDPVGDALRERAGFQEFGLVQGGGAVGQLEVVEELREKVRQVGAAVVG